LVAIPASLLGTNGVYIPNWNAFRDAPISSGSTNNETYIAMSQISSVGSPSTPISPVNIDFTISSINNWVVSPTGTVWATASQFPVYCWAEIAPNANSGATLAPTTLYKMFVQESFQGNAVLATTVYDIVLLRAAGYQI